MDVRALLAALTLAAVVAAPAAAAPRDDAVRYLLSRQDPSGGFAEPGRAPTPGLTAWAVLGLRAAGVPSADLASARSYLIRSEDELESPTDVALASLAHTALGVPRARLLERIGTLRQPSGAIGPAINSTVWCLLALRAAGESAPPETVRWLLAMQRRSGGWSWHPRLVPDTNDTAAAIQALRAVGVRARHPAIRRGVRFLRAHQRRDGGFALTRARASDAMSTAWAVQALVAARERPNAAAYRFLARMRRSDGSYRYSARFATTPVWVTAQVLPALAGKPFPLR